MERHVRWALPAFCVLIFAIALTGVRANGDAREYALMARAFATHATPDIRKAEVAWLVRTEPFLGRFVPVDRLEADDVPATIPHVSQGESGRFYSLHFWLYSLLAAPFVVVTDALGVRPLLALSAVNATAACALVTYLLWFFRGTVTRFVAPLLVLSCGLVFYLRWPGPEVMTAACVLVATLSGLRGQLGVGILAASVAAAQNPSAAGIAVFVVGHWLSLRLGWLPPMFEGSGAVPCDARQLSLTGAAVALLLLPYGFFELAFGLPSVIARVATERELIGLERAWSLLFDLNQGLFPAMPGLLFAVTLLGVFAYSRRLPDRPADTLFRAALVLGAFVVMLVPTLSIHNWNSGGVVVHRYCTWLCMPLLGFVLAYLSKLAARAQRQVAFGFLAAQSLVIAANGLSAEPTLYMQHGTLARFVLQHGPSSYNPIPEIFIERTLAREVTLKRDQIVVWPRGGGDPRKILVHASRPLTVARGCQPGQLIVGATEAELGDGWRYVNAPFRCTEPRENEEPGAESPR